MIMYVLQKKVWKKVEIILQGDDTSVLYNFFAVVSSIVSICTLVIWSLIKVIPLVHYLSSLMMLTQVDVDAF